MLQEVIKVQVPSGAQGGATMVVDHPSGKLTIKIPEGLKSGDIFDHTVSAPTAGATSQSEAKEKAGEEKAVEKLSFADRIKNKLQSAKNAMSSWSSGTGFKKDQIKNAIKAGIKINDKLDADGKMNPNYLIEKLQQMLSDSVSYGLPGTDGSFKSTLIETFRNEHPLLSICLCHPLHKFSSRERSVFLWNSLCMLFFWSVLFGTRTKLTPFAQGIVVSVLTYPFDWFVKSMLECKCCIRFGVLGNIAEGIGGVAACLLSVFSIIWLISGIILAANSKNGADFVGGWMIATTMSYFVYSNITIVLHHIWKWRKDEDKEYFHSKFSSQFENGDQMTSLSDVGKVMEVRLKAKVEQGEYSESELANFVTAFRTNTSSFDVPNGGMVA
jgi:hypothetical protein